MSEKIKQLTNNGIKALIEMYGMLEANHERELQGYAHAYGEQAFNTLSSELERDTKLESELEKVKAERDRAVKQNRFLLEFSLWCSEEADESWCTCGSEEGDGCYYHEFEEFLASLNNEEEEK